MTAEASSMGLAMPETRCMASTEARMLLELMRVARRSRSLRSWTRVLEGVFAGCCDQPGLLPGHQLPGVQAEDAENVLPCVAGHWDDLDGHRKSLGWSMR